MAEAPKRKHKPKRATDKRRTYAATLGAQKVSGGGDGDGNGTARAMGLFNDRRTNIGQGKRAS